MAKAVHQMSYSRQSSAVQKADELKHKLEKLNSKQTPKNVFKKLPGYGSVWFYKKPDSQSTQEAAPRLESAQITAFVKKLRTRPPPEDLEENMEHVVRGPGFEFPTEREANRSNRHWSKRFKHWQPSLPSVPSTPRPVLKIKPPSTNEIEIEGKRYRRVDTPEERQSLWPSGIALMHRRRPSPNEAQFFGELFKDDDVECRFVVAKASEEEQLKEMLNTYAVTQIYTSTTLATTITAEIEKRKNEESGATVAGRRSPMVSPHVPSPRL